MLFIQVAVVRVVIPEVVEGGSRRFRSSTDGYSSDFVPYQKKNSRNPTTKKIISKHIYQIVMSKENLDTKDAKETLTVAG